VLSGLSFECGVPPLFDLCCPMCAELLSCVGHIWNSVCCFLLPVYTVTNMFEMLCLSVQHISGCSRYILDDKFRSYRMYLLGFWGLDILGVCW
jgi:hypothetical protein